MESATGAEAGRVMEDARPSLAHESSGLLPSQKLPDSTGALPMPPETTLESAAPAVRLYPSSHRITMTRYATSTDPRGYIPVYEYQIAGAANPQQAHTIMIDCETGFVQFTGIWKALGHLKADVVKLIDSSSSPEIASQIKKIRGGYLKIQGTWIAFDMARLLARRVAYHLRHDLIPIFGPSFADECLAPGEPGFGRLLLSQPKQRATSAGRRPRADRKQLPYGQSDAYGRPPPASAYHQTSVVVHPSHAAEGAGPARRRVASSAERYQPYGQWAPSNHYLPTPPPSSGMLPPASKWSAYGMPARAPTWHPAYDSMHSAVPLMQQNGNVPAPLSMPKVPRPYTSASDQDAVSSLMSMAGTPSLVLTPKSAVFPASVHSMPAKIASAPACVPPLPVGAPLPSFSTRWSPSLLAPPGHYSLKHAHESNMRSGSAEPAAEEDKTVEVDTERASSAPPLISPTTRLPFHQPMAAMQQQAMEAMAAQAGISAGENYTPTGVAEMAH